MAGVARGFFLQDMTYGFDSLDGFVVWFKGNNFATKWGQSSLKITKKQYDPDQTALDLTATATWASNNHWGCEIRLDTKASPEYEQLYCTRQVPTSNNFKNLEVKYQSRVVTNAIGYIYKGPTSGKSEWVIGGQITMDAVSGGSYAIGSMAAISAALLAAFTF